MEEDKLFQSFMVSTKKSDLVQQLVWDLNCDHV